MWNRKLKERIKELERRINKLEHPFVLNREDKVFGYECYGSFGYYCKVLGDFKVIETYRNVNGFPRYSVYSKKKGVTKDLYLSQIITNKPKKNEYTEA